MGESKYNRALGLTGGDDGIVYKTYTKEEIERLRLSSPALSASAKRGIVFRARKKNDKEYKESERQRKREIRARNPSATRAYFDNKKAKEPEWIDAYREDRQGTARRGDFIPIDSEGQNYPYSDTPEKDIYYDGKLYPPHGTYLWGAYSDRTKRPLYLTDARSKGAVKYKLGVKAIFDWLLNDVKGTYGDANYVMFGMSYDMTQLLCQLPHDDTYEIFKGLRYADEQEYSAPHFWKEYAIKLIQGKWFILWRLRDHNRPYKMDGNGNYVLDKKGRKRLDAVQKIQVFETFGYFQTGFAKVVEDMMKEQKASAQKQLTALADREAFIASPEFEMQTRKQFEGKPLGSYISASGETIAHTIEARVRGERAYQQQMVDEARKKVEEELHLLAMDKRLIDEMKPLRGDFRTKEIEPIREYMSGELRQLAVRMEQIRKALAELDLFPTSWHGPGAVATALILKYGIRNHFGNDISTIVKPGSPQDFAHHAFAGGRIELLQQGYMKAGYLAAYDLSSAYPTGAVELPSLAPDAGEWIHRTKEQLQFDSLKGLRELVEDCSIVSMFKVKWFFPIFEKLGRYVEMSPYEDPTSLNIPFYPLWYRTNSGRILCPSSGLGVRNREDVLAAIAWMECYMKGYPKKNFPTGTGSDGAPHAFFEIQEAWVWEINEGYESVRPFSILKDLYAKRRAIKDRIEAQNKEIDRLNKERSARGEAELPYEYDIMEKVLKLILNSVYGKLAQYVGSADKVPKCASPYYAAAITAYCRRRLLEAALIDPRAIVFFATDGIMATRPLHHLTPGSRPGADAGVVNCPKARSLPRAKDESLGDVISLGDWEYVRRDGGVFVMAGVYVHYLIERDESGAFIFDAAGRPKVKPKYTGRLRGGDISKYAEGNDGQPWLVSQALEAWRKPFNLEDRTTYPAIESAYQKFITAGSVLTPRYSPMLRDGQLVENDRIVTEMRYNRAGRWSLKANAPENEAIKHMNSDIFAWNADIHANTKIKRKWSYRDNILKLGLIDPIPEIVFKRVIHVHDVGLKRVHSKSQWHGYYWLDEHEPLRCSGLIETVPAGNLTLDEDGNKVLNWEMSAPRMPEWLNKADEEAMEDEETGIEVSYSTLCYDGETELTMDRYEDM